MANDSGWEMKGWAMAGHAMSEALNEKLKYGVAACGAQYRVAVLDEKGLPFEVFGAWYTYESHAQHVADRLNVGVLVWTGFQLLGSGIGRAAQGAFVAVGLLGLWWIS